MQTHEYSVKIITYSERKTVMKKLIALVLSVLMLTAVLAGCGSGTSLADVKKAGTLTIATSPDFPPFESLGENNAVEGIEIVAYAIIGKGVVSPSIYSGE